MNESAASSKQMEYLKSLIEKAINAHVSRRDYEISTAEKEIKKQEEMGYPGLDYRPQLQIKSWQNRAHTLYFWQLILNDFDAVVLETRTTSKLIDLFKSELQFNPTYAVDTTFAHVNAKSIPAWLPDLAKRFMAYIISHKDFETRAAQVEMFEASLNKSDGDLVTVEGQRQVLIEAGVDPSALNVSQQTERDIEHEQEKAREEIMRSFGRTPYLVNIDGQMHGPTLKPSATMRNVGIELEKLTTDEVAQQLGISKRAVQKAIERGSLKASKHGRDWTVRRDEVEKYRRDYLRKPGRKTVEE